MKRSEISKLISQILVAKVERIRKHENADKLWIVDISVGDKTSDFAFASEDGTIQIVTGADNVKEGDLVPYLAPGNIVPGWKINKGEEVVLESRQMRGEMSHGMILSVDEIGAGNDHEGIFIIKSENTEDAVGRSLVDVIDMGKKIDEISGISITPEIQEKIDLISSIGDPNKGGEVVGADELSDILTSGEELYTYDGFEPSGQMHIAQGIVRAINTNKMIEAGFTFRMWVADWFGYLNNKMGGDMEKIQKVGKYFIEIWKAAGMNLDKTEFLWTSDFVGDKKYWETVMKVMKSTSLKRILRTTEIMGRSETDDLTAANILYPAMQTTDIFHVMKAQVTQLGMDQRKVNMLARELGPTLGFWKPVVVSHGMVQGLGKPLSEDSDTTARAISMKMSKSKPDTAIFMTDSAEEVERKITKAYCPPGKIKDNPILDYCKQIIFEAAYLRRETPLLEDGKFVVNRKEEFGGSISFSTYKELEETYAKGEETLHPMDLKDSVIGYINALLDPVRKHFKEEESAKKLLEEVREFQITR